MAETVLPSGPSVPLSGAPLPVNPPPEAFGATTLGEGLKQAGQTGEQVSQQLGQTAMRLQTLYNDANVANRSIDAAQAGTERIAQFKQLKMNAAVMDYPNVMKDVEDITNKGMEGLPPAAQIQYRQQTRRLLFGELADAKTWVATQGNAYTMQSMNDLVTAAGEAYSKNPGVATEDTLHQAMGDFARNFSTQNGLHPESNPGDAAIVRQQLLKLSSPIYSQMVEKMLVGNDPAADAFYEQHRGDISLEHQGVLDKAFASKASSNIAYSNVQQILSGKPSVWTGGDTGMSSTTNNNPTNLKKLPGDQKWEGEIPSTGEFAAFATPQAGVNAAVHNLLSYGKEGIDTLYGIAAKWAPKKDGNDPVAYAEKWGKSLGIDPNAKLNMTDTDLLTKLVTAQGPLETGGKGGIVTKGQPGTQVQLEAIPPLGPGVDPEEWASHAQRVGYAELAQMYKGNAPEMFRQQGILDSEINRLTKPWTEQNAATMNSILDKAIKNGWTTMEEAKAADPVEIAQLPGKQQVALETSLGQLGNAPSATRANNAAQVTGLLDSLGDNPNAMDNVNLDTLDLQNNDRKAFKDKLAAFQNKQWKPDSSAYEASKYGTGKQTLDAIKALDFKGLADIQDPEERKDATAKAQQNFEAHSQRFIGALAMEVTRWKQHNQGQKLDTPVMDSLIANVTAGLGPGGQALQGRGFEIPETELPAVDSLLHANHWAVTDWNRGRAWDYIRQSGRAG